MNWRKFDPAADKKKKKRGWTTLLFLLAALSLCAGGCGKKKNRQDDTGGKPVNTVQVKPQADISPAVYSHKDEATGEEIHFYLAWEEDGGDMRMVFFGRGDGGTVVFTETDGGYYCGTAGDDVIIGGKKHAGESIAVRVSPEGSAELKIGAGEEGVLKCDGEVWIRKAPFGSTGIYFSYQMSPLMILSGDGFCMTAEMSDDVNGTYFVKNIFYCTEMQDEQEKYTLRNISSLPDHAIEDDVFWVLDNYYGNDRALNLVWMHLNENDLRDETLNGFTTYYYRFYDSKAPEGFVNRDGEGKWGAMEYDAADTLFAPKTEDYIIRCRNTATGVYDSGTQEYQNFDTKVFELYAFNGVGENVQTLRKTVFPDADAAQAYKEYMDPYYELTVKGSAVYEDRTAYDCYVGKQERLLDCIGGITTYADHCYYEDVHYYRFEEIWFDQLTEVYVSAPPKKPAVQEHLAVIGRRGTYAVEKDQMIRLGCDYDSYYIDLRDEKLGTLQIDETIRDIRFDEAGFYAFLKKEAYKLVIRADYVANGLKVKCFIFKADELIGDYDMKGVTPQQTVEKTYQLQGK